MFAPMKEDPLGRQVLQGDLRQEALDLRRGHAVFLEEFQKALRHAGRRRKLPAQAAPEFVDVDGGAQQLGLISMISVAMVWR